MNGRETNIILATTVERKIDEYLFIVTTVVQKVGEYIIIVTTIE